MYVLPLQVVSDMQQMKARHVDIVGRIQYAYSDIQQESQVTTVIKEHDTVNLC